jgi:hypothetical protein
VLTIAASLRLKTSSVMMTAPSLRFQTNELRMWIIRRKTVSDEQQDSIQQLENRFRSSEMECLILINKSKGFSQSLSGVLAGGDIIWQKPNISR